jgi:hypothetical protein
MAGETPEGFVVITATDQYNQLQKLTLEVHRMTTLFEPGLISMRAEIMNVAVTAAKNLAEVETDLEKVDRDSQEEIKGIKSRLARVEMRIYMALGGAGVLSTGISLLVVHFWGK